jgi:predicted nucleic acid-binding protein
MLTGRPHPFRVAPVDAARIVAHTSKRFRFISLTASEYVAAIDGLAGLGHSGGMIYDALILACARKAKATRIYTLNQRHFRLIAPDLSCADRRTLKLCADQEVIRKAMLGNDSPVL